MLPATLRDLDTAELDRLEVELAAAEQTLKDADLDAQFVTLTNANDQVSDIISCVNLVTFAMFEVLLFSGIYCIVNLKICKSLHL